MISELISMKYELRPWHQFAYLMRVTMMEEHSLDPAGRAALAVDQPSSSLAEAPKLGRSRLGLNFLGEHCKQPFAITTIASVTYSTSLLFIHHLAHRMPTVTRYSSYIKNTPLDQHPRQHEYKLASCCGSRMTCQNAK